MASRFRADTLSGSIYRTVLAFALAVVVALSAVFAFIYYQAYERDGEAKLVALAQDAAAFLNAAPRESYVMVLEEQFSGLLRYTLIAQDGTVLFDSAADEALMENHATRPEVTEAEAAGEGMVVRYSETLQTDTIYAAVRLDDGSIVRLSETRESLASFLGSMVPLATVSLVVVAVLVFLLSRLLTRRIMKPIDAIDLSNPLDNSIYEEMRPLLASMDEQQRRLKAQNAELALAESMRRDFSSNVSHEMKTPLQVISGYAELLKNGMVQPDDQQKFAGLIYDEAQSMRKLIDDVLTLSRLDETSLAAEAVPVEVRMVAERMAARLEPFARERGVLLQVGGARALVMGSEALMEEMLHNLMENGIRYNRIGGSVTVDVELEDGQERTVVVRVADTGIGIPVECRDKVFERFFRVDKSRSKETGGTGLGLAIVKHAVQYHGGTIELDSTDGAGTTFTLRLPAAPHDVRR